MRYKANESQRHKISKVRYRVENWAAYDAARRPDDPGDTGGNRRLDACQDGAGRHGRPSRYSGIAIEAEVMLRLAFGRPWRQTEGLLCLLVRLLGLELPVPRQARNSCHSPQGRL
jgi:hypothetical protein